MLALGIESAGETAGIALADDAGVVAEYSFRHHQNLTRRLVPSIARLLDDTGLPRESLELVAVSVGPGSFTGIRIAVTTAKTIAQALGIGIVGIPTLEAFARGALGAADGLVCATLHARRDEFYVGLFRQTDRAWQTLVNEEALTVEKLAALIAEQDQPVLVCGEAVIRGLELLAPLGHRVRIADSWQSIPRAAAVAAMGILRAREGKLDDLMALAPKYTRPSQAETRLEEGKLSWDRK